MATWIKSGDTMSYLLDAAARAAERRMIMHCKKCLHYEVCVKLGKPSLYGINQEIGCSAYKDKTKWAEKKIGKWVKNHQNDNIVYCDQCYMPQDMPTPFCHSCGAEMVYE